MWINFDYFKPTVCRRHINFRYLNCRRCHDSCGRISNRKKKKMFFLVDFVSCYRYLRTRRLETFDDCRKYFSDLTNMANLYIAYEVLPIFSFLPNENAYCWYASDAFPHWHRWHWCVRFSYRRCCDWFYVTMAQDYFDYCYCCCLLPYLTSPTFSSLDVFSFDGQTISLRRHRAQSRECFFRFFGDRLWDVMWVVWPVWFCVFLSLFFDLNYCCMHLSQADGFDVIRLKILFLLFSSFPHFRNATFFPLLKDTWISFFFPVCCCCLRNDDWPTEICWNKNNFVVERKIWKLKIKLKSFHWRFIHIILAVFFFFYGFVYFDLFFNWMLMHCVNVVIRLFCDYFSSSSLSSLSLSVTSFIITRNQEQNNKQFTCVNVDGDGGGGGGDDDDDERIWRHTESFIARFRHCCMDSRSRIVYFVPSPSLSGSLSLSLSIALCIALMLTTQWWLCVFGHIR